MAMIMNNDEMGLMTEILRYLLAPLIVAYHPMQP